MIHIFRKEMKKWHTVLWVVLVSLVFGGTSVLLFRPKHWSEMPVATVNGRQLVFERYRRSLAELEERIESIRSMARAYGMSEEMFLSTFLGSAKPDELALKACVDELLVDAVKDDFDVTLDTEWFKQELVKQLLQMTNSHEGSIDMDAYRGYLHRLHMTPAQFEAQKGEEFTRNLVNNFIFNAAALPSFVTRDFFDHDYMEKSFVIAKFPSKYFADLISKEGIKDDELASYYRDNKEMYRVEEKRKARMWQFSGAEYGKKAVSTIDPAALRNFYERNKGSLFRIAPKIKVRHILFAAKDRDLAQKVQKEATAKPQSFAALAKQYSQDAKSVSTGGLTDFFVRGSFDPEFERAAFRLHTTDEISSVVKTKHGFEVIQLVDRIAATEKPFEAVKEEIEKTLKARKSLTAARNDLATLIRTAKEDKVALERFVQDNGLKEQQTALLTQADAHGDEIIHHVARQLFSPDKRQNSLGYVVHKDTYAIYQLAEVQKSYIPAFEQIKDRVRNDWLQEKADERGRKILKELRGDILAKKMSLQEAAGKYGTSVVSTKKAGIKSGIEGLSEAKAIQDQLFNLSDANQVAQARSKDTFYLAQLKEASPVAGANFEQMAQQIAKKEKYKMGSLLVGAFIASLHRNAKIEIDQKVLSARHIDLKD